MSNSFEQVNDVLAYNVVNEKDALVRVNTKYLQGLQQCKIDILLLFALKQVGQGIRHKTAVSGTGDADDAGNITGLGRK